MDDPGAAALRVRLAPSGVYYGWIIAGACSLAAATMFGATYSFSVFADALLSAFPATRATVSLVFGVQTAVIYLASPMVGALADRHGGRRVLAAGAALLAGGLLWAASSQSLAELGVAYGVVAGLGLSAVYVVAYSTVPKWFHRRRGLANGLATAGLGVGLVVVPPLADRLLAAFGWRGAYVAMAGLFLAMLALVVAVFADEPAAVDADPAREFPEGRPEAATGGWAEQAGAVLTSVRTPAFALVLAGWTFVYGTLYVLMAHVVPFATDAGLGRAAGVTAIAVVGVTTSAARLALGYASDRIGRVRMFVACSLVMGATVPAFVFASAPPALWALAVVFGVGYGGNGALLSPLVADLFGTENLTALYGSLSVAFALAGLAAPPLAGLAFEATGSYVVPFVGVGVVGVLGAGCIAAAGQRQRRVDG
jgi:MFS family permease